MKCISEFPVSARRHHLRLYLVIPPPAGAQEETSNEAELKVEWWAGIRRLTLRILSVAGFANLDVDYTTVSGEPVLTPIRCPPQYASGLRLFREVCLPTNGEGGDYHASTASMPRALFGRAPGFLDALFVATAVCEPLGCRLGYMQVLRANY